MELLKEHVNNTVNLGKAEQFFIEVMGIPRLEARLESWLYKRTFQNRLESLEHDISALDNTCSNVKGSFKLLKVLEVLRVEKEGKAINNL